MSDRCHKCRQADPYLGDSWCLACSAVEEVAGELRSAWGSAGSRSVATDILVSATRSIRALRRLGLAGGGRVKPAEPEVAGTRLATEGDAVQTSPQATPAPTPPPAEAAKAPGKETVKTEEVPREAGDKKEETSEDEESGEEEDPEEDPPESSGLKSVPKAKADNRESLPRRRHTDQVDRSRGADSRRAPTPDYQRRQHSPPRRSERDYRERSRSRRRHHREEPERSRRREEPEVETKSKEKKNRRKKKTHRAGRKHKRQARAEQDPYRRLHYRKPPDFWDQPPSLRH
eukprot:s2746_g3.t1